MNINYVNINNQPFSSGSSRKNAAYILKNRENVVDTWAFGRTKNILGPNYGTKFKRKIGNYPH